MTEQERIQTVNQARKTAVVHGVLLIIAMGTFVYAFLQKAKAKKFESLAIKNAQVATESARLAEKTNQLMIIKENQLQKELKECKEHISAAAPRPGN